MEIIRWDYNKFYCTGGEGIKVIYKIHRDYGIVTNTGIRGTFDNWENFKNYEADLSDEIRILQFGGDPDYNYYICILRTTSFVECKFAIFAEIFKDEIPKTIWLNNGGQNFTFVNPRFYKITKKS